MHADISQLIALRDGEPVDAVAASHVSTCPVCRRKLDDFRRLRQALQKLPQRAAPAASWELILARRKLETLPSSRMRYASLVSLLPVAMALLLAFLLPQSPNLPDRSLAVIDGGSVEELRVRSRELENLLQRYHAPTVMSLRAAGAVSELEDSIALIDYQLSGLHAPADARYLQNLWQRRVELMETLVTVRATETYLDSI